jgi:hypothetical protein
MDGERLEAKDRFNSTVQMSGVRTVRHGKRSLALLQRGTEGQELSALHVVCEIPSLLFHLLPAEREDRELHWLPYSSRTEKRSVGSSSPSSSTRGLGG